MAERVQAVRGHRLNRARRDKHGRETRGGHIRARAQGPFSRVHVVANRHPRMCLTRGGAPMRLCAYRAGGIRFRIGRYCAVDGVAGEMGRGRIAYAI